MKYIFVILFLFHASTAITQTENNYKRFIDSADIALDNDPHTALLFLDSIPIPIEKHIEGRIGEYYLLEGFAFNRTMQQAKVYQSFLLAIRYAQEEKDFDTAGNASLQLFSNTYFVKKDSTAYKHLESAKKFYTLSNNKYGLTEVEQMPAYVAYVEHDYKKSIELILPHLDHYKNIEDDAYYYLFATFMVASNFLHLNDLNKANKYIKEFQSLKANPTITLYNYRDYEVALNICISKLYLDRKQIDSTLYYLSNANKLKSHMSVVTMGKYYSFSAEAYDVSGDNLRSREYLDSLKQFQEKLVKDNINASVELNNILVDSEETIRERSAKISKNNNLILILCFSLFGLIILVVFFFKRAILRKKEHLRQQKISATLESNQEKLKVKNSELENYISDIKEKFKEITLIKDEDTKKDRVRSLYRSINANSSIFKNNEENHLLILKPLNESFLNKIKDEHPNLTEMEFLICYYIKVGFKNKEIAFFLNRSIRSIESQRYRISKKIKLKNSKDLISYLNQKYSA